jgi:hypothetical protein
MWKYSHVVSSHDAVSCRVANEPNGDSLSDTVDNVDMREREGRWGGLRSVGMREGGGVGVNGRWNLTRRRRFGVCL